MDVFKQIAANFGLEWPKFIAQIIVFWVVFAILRAKAFGPVVAMLEERRRRIEEGEEKLKKIQTGLEQAEAKSQEIIAGANQNAERLIAEARESSQVLTERKAQEAVAEASQIIAKAREATALEKTQAMVELKREFGRLVVETTAKVTGKVLTDADQNAINQETAQQINLN
jgi:F-type H+-transporting ATPase subunit b